MKLPHIDNGAAFDWGRASKDYALYRDIYPESYYNALCGFGFCQPGRRVLDLGTGTGVLPRALHGTGAHFTGVDISENQIAMARELSAGMGIDYVCAPAEQLDFPDGHFDAVTAAQCFFYFDQSTLFPFLHRVLKPGGLLCIAYMFWLPYEDDIANASEQMVLRYNPSWSGSGARRSRDYMPLQAENWFDSAQNLQWAESLPFTRESWHGRIRACRGISASTLSEADIAAFDAEHRAYMNTLPEQFTIAHDVSFTVLRRKDEKSEEK